MVEEEDESLVDLLVLDEVVVVEDEDEALSERLEVVDEGRQDVLHDTCAAGVKKRERVRADQGLDRPDRFDRVRPEPYWVVVPWIHGKPCETARPSLVALPRGEKRRLPPSGGSSDERQPLHRSRGRMLDERRTGNEVASRRRRPQLRREDHRRSGSGPRTVRPSPAALRGNGADCGSFLSAERLPRTRRSD